MPVKRVGYSGLMLPVLEDPRIAQRWSEGALSIDALLAYSSVCATGLDTVPLPGDVSEEQLARILGDVASLAYTWKKPLTARLLPVKGKGPAGAAISTIRRWRTRCYSRCRELGTSDRRQHLLQELAVRAGVGGRRLGRVADGAALDHDRPAEPGGLQHLETPAKSTLPAPNWIITSPFGSPQSFAQNPVTYWTMGFSPRPGPCPCSR